MPRLKRSRLTEPGISRMRRGKGFCYVDPEGDVVKDPEERQRIKDLVIPPAWEQVWICPYPNGHIQAVGYDDAGRKQYIYHPNWRARRDQEKFRRMIEFAHCLPDLRRQTRQSLMDPDVSRERVLAVAVRMLDRGLFRIGGEQYAARNSTYGIATLLKRHVRLGPDYQITVDFQSKHHKRQKIVIVDPDVYEVLAQLKRRRNGNELLAFKDAGRWVDVKTTDINDFIRSSTGGEFTSKDFRTWSATVLAAVALAKQPDEDGLTARRRAVTYAVKEVAGYLGNTPAVCRSSYIFPRIIDEYFSGVTIAPRLQEMDSSSMSEWQLREAIDATVLALIEGKLSGRRAA